MEGSLEANTGSFKVRVLTQNEEQQMQEKGVWKIGCPVPLNRLRAVEFSYWHLHKDSEDSWSFKEEQKREGKIVVLDAAAEGVCQIFKKLHEMKFPIHKARPMEEYDGNDEKSMADNNSSSFQYREITGGGSPSLHAYGLAIDINPIQNPYIAFLEDKNIQGSGNSNVLPSVGRLYMNRTNLRPGMVEDSKERDAVIKVFKDHGFPVWGGKWNTPIDWQHFQPSRVMAQLLVAMSPEDAAILFKAYAKDSDLLTKADPKNNGFVSLYAKDPEKFMESLKNNPSFLKMSAEEAGV